MTQVGYLLASSLKNFWLFLLFLAWQPHLGGIIIGENVVYDVSKNNDMNWQILLTKFKLLITQQ